MKTVILALTAAAALGGCATSGTRVAPGQLRNFRVGVTTEAQVEAALGRPQATAAGSGGTTAITYVYSQASAKAADYLPIVGLFAGGARGEAAVVTLTFSRRGRLLRYRTYRSKTDIHTGL